MFEIFDQDFNEDDLKKALELVYRYTHVRMAASKKVLLRSRLRSRLVAHQLREWSEYWPMVENDPAELSRFVDLVTTHETYFHRTQGVWEYFSKEFLPQFFKRCGSTQLKIWSAACSTGEEPYTLAMYCEDFAKSHSGFHYSILASDISNEVLSFAKVARYQGRSLEALKKGNPTFVDAYMKAVDSEVMEVIPVIRSKISFHQKNLFQPKLGTSCFDLVLLRNVLIYFAANDQEKVIETIRGSLNQHGILVIGESESLSPLKTQMEFIKPLVYTSNKAA